MPDNRDWAAIQKEIEAGEIASVVAKKYRVARHHIYNRSFQEKWATPTRVKEVQMAIEQSGVKGKVGRPAKKVKPPKAKEDLQTTSNSGLSEEEPQDVVAIDPRQGYAAAVAFHVAKKLQRALPKLPDPKTWRDANTADTMVRRAMGLDKQTLKVGGLFNTQGSDQAGFAVEISTSNVGDEGPESLEESWFDG